MATVKRGKGLLYSTEAEAEIIFVSQFCGPEIIPGCHGYHLECVVDSLGQALELPQPRALGMSLVFEDSSESLLGSFWPLFCPPLSSPSVSLWHLVRTLDSLSSQDQHKAACRCWGKLTRR